jgi:predicted transcriptional regulator of viral defense system
VRGFLRLAPDCGVLGVVAIECNLLTNNYKLQHTGIMTPRIQITHEQAVLELARTKPLLRALDLAHHQLPTIVLTRMVATGKLKRVARGVYGLPGLAISEHRSLAEVALRVPKGVVCLLSALRVHGIGTQAPFEVWLAIENRAPTPRLDQPKIRPVRMSGAAFTVGIEHRRVDGVSVPVFNAAKTVADCFKYRNKIGLDVALEALRDGWAHQKFTMDEIWHFATVDRVANVMRPYLESVTT